MENPYLVQAKYGAELLSSSFESLSEEDAGQVVQKLTDKEQAKLNSSQFAEMVTFIEPLLSSGNLHAARSDRDGYFRVLLSVIAENLCCPGRKFREKVDEALSDGSGAVVGAICTGMALTGQFVLLAVPIAAYLAQFGVDALCRWQAGNYGPCEPA